MPYWFKRPLLLKVPFQEEQQSRKQQEADQYPETPSIVFFMKFLVFSIAYDHCDDKGHHKTNGKDQLSGTNHNLSSFSEQKYDQYRT
jgi:hypothetical protein